MSQLICRIWHSQSKVIAYFVLYLATLRFELNGNNGAAFCMWVTFNVDYLNVQVLIKAFELNEMRLFLRWFGCLMKGMRSCLINVLQQIPITSNESERLRLHSVCIKCLHQTTETKNAMLPWDCYCQKNTQKKQFFQMKCLFFVHHKEKMTRFYCYNLT